MSEEEVGGVQVSTKVIDNTPVSKWERTEDPDLYYLHTSLGENTGIYGELHYDSNDQAEIYVHMINVSEDNRRKGIGTKLLNSFLEEARGHGATSLFGHITNEAALSLFGKTFGEGNLKFFRYNQLTRERSPLDLNYNQIVERINQGEKVDFGISVNLNK